MTRTEKFIIYVTTALFVMWSVSYIYRSSFTAIDGNRYFSLLDDSMISMRYAWNLSHGYGLVWNPGERVEGYTNLLMTLIMSLATWLLDKKTAVIAIQLLGIPTILAVAFLTKRIAQETNQDGPSLRLIKNLSFISVLLYFPLSYWTLMGMETGLVTVFVLCSVLFTFLWLHNGKDSLLYSTALACGLAFLARNDAFIYAVLVFGFLILQTIIAERGRTVFLKIAIAIGVYGLFIGGQIIFRWVYYGALLPNTYILKISGTPLSVRLNDGVVYVFSFMRESVILLLLALFPALYKKTGEKWFMFMFPIAAMAYAVWSGGDSWERWRFIAPAVPLALIIACDACITIGGKLIERSKFNRPSKNKDGKLPSPWPSMIAVGLTLFMMVSVDLPYLPDIIPNSQLADSQENQRHMNQAIAIENLTTSDASIGVFWAGLIPYYTGRHAVDFLGKSDKYIASLPPHLPDNIVWFRNIVQPGHDKYDLSYSIKELQPTYIQRLNWVDESVGKWGTDNYIQLAYQGPLGIQIILVKKDSPYILWDKGTIKPWPGD